jgi:GntR family transcriptional regulator
MSNAAGRRGPAYQRVADDLLERIEVGEFPPGSRLPTEPQLMETYGVSSTTVRSAVKALAAAGVVETRHGSGTFVTERQLLQVHATYFEDLDHRAGVTTQGAWSTDVLNAGRKPTTRFESVNVPADPDVAELLEVDPGATLVMRRAWRYVDGIPTAIEASVFPPWLVEEFPQLAVPKVIQQGTTSWLAEQGHPMHFHRDFISARPPNRDEARFFEPPPGVCSLVRRRVSYDEPGGQVLRVMDTIYRSDMSEVVYDVPGRGNKAQQ